jgi:two-component sensor histidine kinase
MFGEQFADIRDASVLAQAIVDTVREPFVVLDGDLRVVAASRSFYSAFTFSPLETQGKLLYELGDGEWNIPELLVFLGTVLSGDGEVERDFPDIGRRTMLLNARKVFYQASSRANILLRIEEITYRHLQDREKDELLRQKDVLLGEIQHRIGNSLQIIANIILSKAKAVESDEIRQHLKDAHNRVISIAAVQQHLQRSPLNGTIDLELYLATLCEAISVSLIGDDRSIALKVSGEAGHVTGRKAESLGLIVTELVINALKHAFDESTKDARITVFYDVFGKDWKLVVADNGRGKPNGIFAQPKCGLGTGIINALAQQLDAQVVTLSGTEGTTVSITHSTFGSR